MTLSSNSRYIELFAGGAALFFELKPQHGVLVDTCKPLISFYEAVGSEPQAFHDELNKLIAMPFCKETYTSIRDEWDGHGSGAKFAADLMYMNRLCFNALFRLNKALKFNAPWGKKPKLPRFPNHSEIMEASDLIKRTQLLNWDYSVSLMAAKAGDTVYADPPYVDMYDGYSSEGFSSENHRQLAYLLKEAVARGVTVIASNIECPLVRELYGDWAEIVNVRVLHSIGAQASSRKKADEVLIFGRSPRNPQDQLELPL